MMGPRPPTYPSPAVIGLIVAIAVFGAIFVLFLAVGVSGPFSSSSFTFAPFCALFAVIVILVVLAAISSQTRSSWIPPPPPIQKPMVPAGMQGPVALNCPNCGAPPQNVDRFGVATCTYCNTRFLVR